MTEAIWLAIELVQDIMLIHILTKFGNDWTKACKVIEQKIPILDNFDNSRVTTAIWIVIELVKDVMPIHILTKVGDDWTYIDIY